MSRTRKKAYTKSKRFDRTCRNHGGCPYCENGRLHQYTKAKKNADRDIEEYLKLQKLD